MIDLATDGVHGLRSRGEVVTAVRRVMLSAHRAGWTWARVHALLTDTSKRKLAQQVHTGRGDRPMQQAQVHAFLRRMWDDTGSVADAGPAWDKEGALAFVASVQESLDASELPDLDRQVMGVVLDLCRQHGTARPAVPVRTVAERIGISRNRAHATLRRLCLAGDWLDLAKRGDQKRANLYRLAPALRPALRPARSEQTTHATSGEPAMTAASITLNLDPDDRDAVLALLAERRRSERDDNREQGDNVVPITRAHNGT